MGKNPKIKQARQKEINLVVIAPGPSAAWKAVPSFSPSTACRRADQKAAVSRVKKAFPGDLEAPNETQRQLRSRY